MKKWLIALCCVLVAGAIAFITVVNGKNSSLDALNRDLTEIQAEVNSLKEKNEESEKTIEGLNRQVADLSSEKEQLTETLEGLNRNLSSSQQKLQSVMYILTDGAQGSIDSVLSPYMKIYEDVKPESPYFESVAYAADRGLMAPVAEEVFGVSEKVLLGELAEGLWALEGKSGTRAEAAADLLAAEKALNPAPAPEAPAAEEAPAEQPAEPEAAEAPAAEEPAEEAAAEAGAEAAEETAAAEQPAEAGAAEEAAEETAAAELPAEAEAAEQAAEGTAAAEQPAEEAAAESGAEAAEETAAAEAAEQPAEEPAVPQEDENTVLTRDRLLALCSVYCRTRGIPEASVTFPASDAAEAVRGDLAMVLEALSRAK